ncbi:Serine/threonine-protein kinase oca2 [Candida viswanathii]|uniref:non-specific serine/threonine protein kinase n=1 Tax=Candida viswanathii TaxID=5486 RepID=A0A367YIC6_9ASCO|nr:Serine/threonine-protein kinase oca2 [Candida viswanathii]
MAILKHDTRLKFSKHDKRVSTLGKGVSGSVELYQSKHNPDFKYAVKIYHSKEPYETKKDYKLRILHEYTIINQLTHPNIIRAYNYDVSFSGTTIKVFLEPGTANLFQLLKSPVDVNTMLDIWIQILLGVSYLHNKNICHRDLKLENIVYDLQHTHVKIIDFATAQRLTHADHDSVGLVGSEKYASPEMYTSIKYNGKSADVWSLGIVLYYLLVRRFPWELATWNNPEYQHYADHRTAIFDGVGYPLGFVDITSQILEPDPSKRVSCGDIEKYIEG